MTRDVRHEGMRYPAHSGEGSPATFRLDGSRLTIAMLDDAFGRQAHVELSDAVWAAVERSRTLVTARLHSDEPAYGINTGFGYMCFERIPPDRLEALQENLILSHAVGVGAPVPDAIVRWIMLLKIVSLTHGVSGISRATLECLIALLNADVLPLIPRQGSLGASGDLAPLSHMVLPMIGVGPVRVDGRVCTAAEALRERHISPIKLGAKEGLALNNGTQFMCAYAAHVAVRARRLVKHADIAAAMTVESVKACDQPFDERLHALRPHPGAIATAKNIRRLLSGSEVCLSRSSHAPVQDPYSIRCIPAVHGASRDALRHAVEVIETELNAVSDNPILFDNGDVVSGGLFHGQPLALVLDYLAIALAELASISERRINLLLGGRAGLPRFLIEDTGINSGFMLPHYTAAALVSENKGLCTPASVDSIPTSLGQEDHVSMGARAAVKCLEVLENAETVLAIEQLCAAQALDFHAPLKPGEGSAAAHAELRRHLDHASSDRAYGEDIQTSLAVLRSGVVPARVEAVTGALS